MNHYNRQHSILLKMGIRNKTMDGLYHSLDICYIVTLTEISKNMTPDIAFPQTYYQLTGMTCVL